MQDKDTLKEWTHENITLSKQYLEMIESAINEHGVESLDEELLGDLSDKAIEIAELMAAVPSFLIELNNK